MYRQKLRSMVISVGFLSFVREDAQVLSFSAPTATESYTELGTKHSVGTVKQVTSRPARSGQRDDSPPCRLQVGLRTNNVFLSNAYRSAPKRPKTSTPLCVSAALAGDDKMEESADETVQTSTKQTIPVAMFNLIKACVGSGVLSLPAGVAAMGDVPAAALPAAALVSALGALSAYAFFTIGRICAFEGGSISSMGEAWEREVGTNSAWIISMACFLTTFGNALSYSIILGDTFSSLAKTAGIEGVVSTRSVVLLIVTIAAVYPLCCLKSLSALAPVSILGVVGILATCAFMAIRSLPGGAYCPGGAFFSSVAPELQPSFGVVGMSRIMSPSLLVLASMAATAYVVHYTAPDFYHSLKDNSLKRFGLMSILGFGGAAAISVAMMSFGFLTFGGASAGMILNNYSTHDIGATLCRLLMGFSLIGSFPFMFMGIKSAFYQLFYKGKEVSNKVNKTVTRTLLGVLTGLALVLKDAGFVVSFNGALFGSAIIYIFPSLMYLKFTERRIKEGSMAKTKSVIIERTFNRVMVGLGLFLAVVGGAVSIMTYFFPNAF